VLATQTPKKETRQGVAVKLLNKKPYTLELECKIVVVGLHLDSDSTEFLGAEVPSTEMKLKVYASLLCLTK